MTSPHRRHLALIMEYLHLPAVNDWINNRDRIKEIYSIPAYIDYTRRAEAAKIDAIFYPDFIGIRRARLRSAPRLPFEPFSLLSAVAPSTSHIGLVGTASTSYTHPYNLARTLSSFDRITQGRGAINLVTSFAAERNYGIDEIPSPTRRYAQAQEYLEVLDKLWDSWPQDAAIEQVEGSRYLDDTRLTDIDHHGEFYSVEGAIDLPPYSPQRPVIFQAGASSDGLDFASRNAEAIFVALENLDTARDYADDLRSRADNHGRDGTTLRILPGLKITTAATQAEADAIAYPPVTDAEAINVIEAIEHEIPAVKLRGLNLDAPVPDSAFPTREDIARSTRRRSRGEAYRQIAERERHSLRATLGAIRHSGAHAHFVGTVDSVVEQIATWYDADSIDGFTLLGGNDLDSFLDVIVPALQKAGITKREYLGPTLRDNLELH